MDDLKTDRDQREDQTNRILEGGILASGKGIGLGQLFQIKTDMEHMGIDEAAIDRSIHDLAQQIPDPKK